MRGEDRERQRTEESGNKKRGHKRDGHKDKEARRERV